MPDTQSVALNVAQSLTEWTAVLAAGSPLLLGVASLAGQAIEWAKREQIDPGPFELLVASAYAKAAQGIANDDAYRQRHGG
jgi:hypothetical protein